MTDLLTKTANLSLLALAALPLIALSVAHADPVTVRTSDLDLSQPAQVAILNARIERAAKQYCDDAGSQNLSRRNACIADFKAEAMDQVKVQRQLQEAGSAKPNNAG